MGGRARYARHSHASPCMCVAPCKHAGIVLPPHRVNVYTGVRYKHDPTIMGWNVLNEPRCPGVCGGVQSSGFRVNNSGFRVQGSGSKEFKGFQLYGSDVGVGVGVRDFYSMACARAPLPYLPVPHPTPTQGAPVLRIRMLLWRGWTRWSPTHGRLRPCSCRPWAQRCEGGGVECVRSV